MGSRLAELQARYKQKQLQEMESKLKKLLPSTEPKSMSTHIATTTLEKRPFEERKQKAGIDRSYPLKPLKLTTTRTIHNVQATKNINTTRSFTKRSITVKNVVEDAANSENENSTDNKGDVLSSDGSTSDLALNNKLKALEISNKVNEKQVLPNKVLREPILNKSLKGVKEKSQLSYKLSTSSHQGKDKLDNKPSGNSTLDMASRGRSKLQPPPQRAPVANRPSAKQNVRGPSSVTRDDLAACKYCNRRFAPDRLQIHEDICAKTGKKKRKAYDALKHRVQGTELEPFVKKGGRASSRVRTPSGKKSNWRQTHNEFISAIKAAKMTQAHIAKGGKISDLPPPPPSSNPDYVQCPHCGRRFNQTAAERHIPKCATYEFNKPKPGAPSKGPPSKPMSRARR